MKVNKTSGFSSYYPANYCDADFTHICCGVVIVCVVFGDLLDNDRVTTHLENLEKSGTSKVVREKSGKWKKSGKSQGK